MTVLTSDRAAIICIGVKYTDFSFFRSIWNLLEPKHGRRTMTASPSPSRAAPFLVLPRPRRSRMKHEWLPRTVVCKPNPSLARKCSEVGGARALFSSLLSMQRPALVQRWCGRLLARTLRLANWRIILCCMRYLYDCNNNKCDMDKRHGMHVADIGSLQP